jgi:hypothetical protein
MAGISEILVGGGVAAVLGAALGGGLKAFGVEVPLVASPRRQVLLLAAGLLLIAAGLWRGEPAMPAPVPAATTMPAPLPMPKAVASGMRLIDFRSSDRGDSLIPGANRGYLLVTTDVALRNATEPAHSLTWTDTSGTLSIGPATIPFRSQYFTNLTDDEPWLGEGARNASPEAVEGGKVAASRDVMFAPFNTGTGRYRWDDFLRAISRPGDENPVFEIQVATAIGEAQGTSIPLRCVARLDEQLAELRRDYAAKGARGIAVTAECGK